MQFDLLIFFMWVKMLEDDILGCYMLGVHSGNLTQLAGISPFLIGNREIHVQSGSIFLPSILVYRRVPGLKPPTR